jgi:excisionase family DNA binding protein
MQTQPTITTLPKLLNYAEAAEVLHLSQITLRQWVSAERIPCVKLGRAVRFTPEMIQEIVQKGVK